MLWRTDEGKQVFKHAVSGVRHSIQFSLFVLFKDIYSKWENSEAPCSHECLQEKEKICLINFWSKYFFINNSELFNSVKLLYEDSESNEMSYNFR